MRTLPDLPPAPECFRQRTMGEILFGHHTYGLTLPRIRSEKNLTQNCGQANIQTHSEFKFCWLISCYTAKVRLQRPWCLYPIWEFPNGGKLSWQLGDGIEGLPFMSWSLCYISWISLYTSIFKKKNFLFTCESIWCMYQILECWHVSCFVDSIYKTCSPSSIIPYRQSDFF